MTKNHPLTATMLRAILSMSMFIVALLGGVGFYFANSKLKDFAVEVSHTAADANASRDNLQNLQRIRDYLKEKQTIVQRTNSIVADSQSYQYQNQIITDLNNYASKAGISITNINFASTQQQAAPSQPATPAIPTPVGVKSTSVSVTLKNPVDYLSLLKFIKSTEQNLTKMQVSKINLSKDAGKNTVTSDVLTIEVYIR